MIIKDNFNLSKLNTFGVKALANKAAFVTCVDDLIYLHSGGFLAMPHVVISKASNILFTGNLERLVLLNMIWGKEIIEENEAEIVLRISSGEFWPDIVSWCVKNNWGGIENMADIPGKAGATPVQNIGAYGSEIKDVIINLQAFDLKSGEIKSFSNTDCEFGYRSSIFKSKFKGNYFITYIDIKLRKNPIPQITYKPLIDSFSDTNKDNISIFEVFEKVCQIRKSKLPDPEITGNAGSFFKNPVININKLKNIIKDYPDVPNYKQDDVHYKIPAGWLIEKCSLKGMQINGVGVHDKQALVIVNHCSSNGKDIIALAAFVKQKVFEKFSIELEFEVNIL